MTQQMPVGFVSHGSPMSALDTGLAAAWKAWADAMPRPESILVVSAHWETPQPALGATKTIPLIYDFSGFPEALYQLQYPAPGAAELAQRVAELADGHVDITREPDRGLDHGAWMPLLCMYPGADIPVLQLGLLPYTGDAAVLLELGRLLSPLREEGVLILGSGSMTHNLRKVDRQPGASIPPWAEAFDRWSETVLTAGDPGALIDFDRQAPQFALAHPTPEHFTPLIFAAGAGGLGDCEVSFPVTGFELGSFSRRCVQFD